MKKIWLLVLLTSAPAAAVWWFAVPSKHDKVTEVFAAVQVGDSRKFVEGLLGPPSSVKISDKNGAVKERRTEASYSFFLVRYAFYYEADGRLARKYMFSSE